MNKKFSKILTFVGVGSLLSFVLLITLVVTSKVAPFDSAIGTMFPRSENLTSVMKAITYLGEAGTIILIGVLVVLLWRDKKDGAEVLLGVGIVAGLNSIIKKIIKRPRPSITHLVGAGGFSFPSGHSASSMMFYGFLIYLVNKRCKNDVLKKVLTVFLSFVILTIGVSRIYLGVHYASDVLAGFSWALSFLTLYIKMISIIEEKMIGDKK